MLPVLALSSSLPAGDPGNAARDASSGSSASAFMPYIPTCNHQFFHPALKQNAASMLKMAMVAAWEISTNSA